MPVANVIECSRLAIGLLSLGQQRAQMPNSHGVPTSAPELSKVFLPAVPEFVPVSPRVCKLVCML